MTVFVIGFVAGFFAFPALVAALLAYDARGKR